jgi:reverse gyrase
MKGLANFLIVSMDQVSLEFTKDLVFEMDKIDEGHQELTQYINEQTEEIKE